MEAVENSTNSIDTPRPFWSSMTLTITSWENALNEILAQISARYSDDGYLDELGSDHDSQNVTFITRIECELLMHQGDIAAGGCGDNRPHEKWVQGTGSIKNYFRALPVKSNDNNCGIACLAVYALRGGWAHERRKYNTVRDELGFHHDTLLSFQELDKVAERFATNYVVFDLNGKRLHTGCCYDEDKGRNAHLLLENEHYQLILAQVGQCLCGKPDGEGHTCRFKGGFCENCACFHTCGVHQCPYSQDNIAARAVQSLAADALRREQAAREQRTKDLVDGSLDAMQNREDFEPILDCIFKLKRSCLVLGPGGVGKTFVALYETRSLVHQDGGKCKTFTPTGQAATLHEDATTAHFGLKLRLGTDDFETIIKRFKDEHYDDWADVTHVLLDEISMFDAAIIQTMDLVVRHLKRRPAEPFGGCVLVGVGDFLQLKPINATHLFFDSEVIRTMISNETMGIYYLTAPIRYPCVKWFDLLCRVRIGKPQPGDIARLKIRMKSLDEWMRIKGWTEQSMPVLACPKNKEADAFNARCSNMLKAQKKKVALFHRIPRKKAKSMEARDLTKLAPASVELIEDAKVMLLVNHSRGRCTTSYLEEHQVGNGSVGWIHAFGTQDEPGALVRFKNGAEVFVGYHSYDDIVDQIPLRLAYASSIHKLQGTSLEEAILSLKDCFCESQAYAALSRVCREENCYITSLNARALTWVDKRCVAMSVATTKKPLPRLELTEEGLWIDPHTATPYMRAKIHTMPKGDATADKVIYFDAETFHNPKGELECYHMELQKLTHGHAYRKKWTKNETDHDVLEDFCAFIVDEVKRDVMGYINCAVRNATKQWLEKPFVLAAYNGSNFDFHMLIKYLFQNGLTVDFKVNMMFRGNTVAYFDVWHVPSGKQCLVLHDLCRLLNCSLSKASEDMLGINLKGLYPHKHMNCHGWQAIDRDEQPRHVTRDDFFPKDQAAMDKCYGHPEELIANFPLIDKVIFDEETKQFVSAEIDLRETLEQYGAMDVEVLRRLYAKLDETVRETFKTTVLNFYSANQMSRYGALLNLPRIARLNAFDNARYIESQLFLLDREMDAWVTDAMYGGRTLPRQTHFKSRHLASLDLQDEGGGQAFPTDLAFPCTLNESMEFYDNVDALLFLDIFSMYVSIMKTKEFAFGKPSWMSEEDVSKLNQRCAGLQPLAIATRALGQAIIDGKWGQFIVDVDLQGNPQDVEPAVPYRTEGHGHHGRVCWDSKRRRGKYTHIDLGLILRNGGRVFGIVGGIRWPFKGRIFESYMDLTLKWKQQGEDSGNEALRSFGKLCGNTVFGGMCMKTQSNSVAMCFTDEEVDLFLKENTWEGAYGYRDGMMLWGKRKSIDDDGLGIEIYSPTSKQVGCIVLAYAREMIDTFIETANPLRRQLMGANPMHDSFETLQRAALKSQPYYGDTDSLVIHASQYRRIRHLLKDEAGYWTDDFNKKWEYRKDGETIHLLSLIFEYYGAAPKSYALTYVKPEKRSAAPDDFLFFDFGRNEPKGTTHEIVIYDLSASKEKFKFKGIPRGIPVSINGTVYTEMNMKLLRQIMLSGISYMDADVEGLPDPSERPQIDLSSIGKVGFKPTTSDYFTGIAPFSLKPVEIRRTLFMSRFVGRKIAFQRKMPGSALTNDVLAPVSMMIGQLDLV